MSNAVSATYVIQFDFLVCLGAALGGALEAAAEETGALLAVSAAESIQLKRALGGGTIVIFLSFSTTSGVTTEEEKERTRKAETARDKTKRDDIFSFWKYPHVLCVDTTA
eukprot:TRINITY_DN17198_c0_g2_i1.p1 TRINITY_DN17198_c0_g2~~TRINITY_DN17198_c0_g2_i1.p1  ORF type:complete len:110 (-),score=4.50 TRINITY_DN17198_c0_g2_i1:5-334(-)